jgi:hypothetical protein
MSKYAPPYLATWLDPGLEFKYYLYLDQAM